MAKTSSYPSHTNSAVHFHHFPKCPAQTYSTATDATLLSVRGCGAAAHKQPASEATTSGPHDKDACLTPAVAPDSSPRDVQSTPHLHPHPQPHPHPRPQRDQLIECKHWLEVQDAYHRYGTFLRAYYDTWTASRTPQPFFAWLDDGAGRVLSSVAAMTGGANKAPATRNVTRAMLDSSRVHYCTPAESSFYVVQRRDKDGLLEWASDAPRAPGARARCVVDTTHDDDRWIFVIDECGRVLVNRKVKTVFHHSSFVAGRAVRAAGRISVRGGVVVMVSPNSGHYRTTREQLETVVRDVLGDDIVVSELSADAPSDS